ncbi:MAG: ParB/RepB/Spo0J family partition protein [Bacilli bacterium]|nr:ParB/RepB/Spo0J family partition protein [Bacilli bacterium]
MDNRKIVELDLNDILPNRFQPRIKFNEDSITELAESIKEHGVIQPIVVRPLGDRYEIIAGERRYKASVLAGKETIPAIVTELNDKDSAEVALIENVQRQDLTPIEEAISYNKILDMGYLTQEELAFKLGKTQSTIANKLRLLKLDDEVQEALLESKISERHARSLLKLTDKSKQKQMLAKIINERLTVRKTDEEISKMMNENDNRNIEIIDFGNQNNNTVPMNQGMNYNIPTTPIVEDVVPTMPQTPVQEAPVINPGFMNVEQIEKTAQDINVVPPVANMDALLTPADMLNTVPTPSTNVNLENPFGVSMETTEAEDGSAEAMLKPGKFFNLSDLENPVMEQKQPVVETPVEQANPILTNPTVGIQSTIESVPMNPSMEQSSIEKPIEVVNNFVTNFDNTMTEKPTPIIPANPEPLIQTPIMEPMSNQTIAVPNYNELESTMYGPVSPITPSVPEMPVGQNNMKQVIDIIRECSSKIEALGFEIETEEYDFEDMYQAIFKINKK